MRPRPSIFRRSDQGGFTLIEVSIALSVMTVILLATSAVLRKETRGIMELQNMGHSEKVMNGAFHRILRTIQFARGYSPETNLVSTLNAAESGEVLLGNVTGFPESGLLVVDRGQATEEIIRYETHAAIGSGLWTLERGVEGTTARGHSAGSSAL
ncbi:prepilin-type N-terminal cleavage/methylation domain-containing protein, partial [bacterium]|nr:prepilin-type N-terminal cleavage/methylation domain-containing protein [bacterium]